MGVWSSICVNSANLSDAVQGPGLEVGALQDDGAEQAEHAGEPHVVQPDQSLVLFNPVNSRSEDYMLVFMCLYAILDKAGSTGSYGHVRDGPVGKGESHDWAM